MSTIVGAREPVRLAGVGRRYGPRGPWVLRGVDAELPAGRLVRVTGANGTGKSTLLRLVAGVDAPAEGRITGRPARTAYVPERFPPALPFTALDYLVHLGRLQGLRTGPARAGAGEWLERFGAGGYAGTPLAALSKGTAQKVAVAQALLAEPELLVLDEAWTGLDPEARAELDAAVRERVGAGATALFVDHDPRRLADTPATTLTVAEGRVRHDPGGSAGLTAAEGRVHRDPHGLAGAPDTTLTVREGHVRHDPGPSAGEPGASPAVAAGRGHPDPRSPGPAPVRVVASGARPLPEPLPGGATRAARAADGSVVFQVAASHSDDLLRALLAAAWHVHRVGPGRAGTEGERP
ncbi:ATP-binding cassette domain-containing protein [Streptomyces sp. NPDC051771]|uniref:ATP-binding cassette domain-containing protein n=1 Tax=Streptomyces sp. NPDC051771 TaxID=3154847 RepID=UPI003446F345